ncbi:hypothetical protein ACJIZ3_003745 [Penstemon smallii]|uniref:Uncharacterized protein n=1 Tax=Penstemon smallii TaxID=265156 RepID=A0ABD3UBE5_9LAMI
MLFVWILRECPRRSTARPREATPVAALPPTPARLQLDPDPILPEY